MLNNLKEKIRNAAADYAEIHLEVFQSSKVIYSKDNIEAVQNSRTSSGNVRVFDHGGWGFASFNDFEPEKSLPAAIQNAKLVSGHRGQAGSLYRLAKPIEANIKTDFEISPDSWTLSQKNDLARRYNDILKDERIASTRTVYSDWKLTKYFVNTEGSVVEQEKVFTGVSFGGMAKEGSNVQQAYVSVGQYGGLELVTGLEGKVEEAKKRAIDLLRAPKVEAGQYLVLLDPLLAGVFAHEAFGHMSEADFLYENPRMQEVMVLGRRFGPEILNIIDDGSLIGLAGYTPYDDEGIVGRKNYLIKDGILTGRLHSRETAAKMKEEPSGNARSVSPLHQPIVRMTNTFIDSGVKSFDEILSTLEDGIYAVDCLGGMTNLEMFTFTAGYGYRVKNGKIGGLVRDVTLSGNVFTTLNNVTEVGNDLHHHGGLGGCGKAGQGGLPVSTGSPHLLIKDVLIGGV